MDKKVFVIGLDGGTWDIINPLIAEGELPTLNNLIKNGTRTVLESTLIPVSPAAWTSFATGSNPDKHEIFDFLRRKKGSYEPVPYGSRDRKCETLWNILSRDGRKVGIINVPGTYPVEKVNGFMITGFPTPEELEDFTYPKNLLEDLRNELGKDFRFQLKVHFQDEAQFLEEIQTLTEYVFQATDYLMNNNPWDFLITVFSGPDAVCHAFWKYMDPEHPLYDARAPREFKHAIFDTYKAIDKKIEALQKNIDSDTTLLLMSDHGFGPLYYGVSINNWLLNEGFLTLKNTASSRIRYWMYRRGVSYYNLLKLTKALRLSKRALKAAYSRKSFWADLVNKFFLTNKDIDWSRSKAYCMGTMGQLFINQKGREPQGIVEPNGEYDELVNHIITKLHELKDPNNNTIIFNEIFGKKEVYPLSRVEDNTPDIIFFNSEMKYTIDKFLLFGSKDLVSTHPLWSGIHTHNGIFLAYGNNRILKATDIDKVSIVDIAPTVLHIMESPISKDMDGRVLFEIFEKDSEVYKRQTVYQSQAQRKEMDVVKTRIRELRGKGKI